MWGWNSGYSLLMVPTQPFWHEDAVEWERPPQRSRSASLSDLTIFEHFSITKAVGTYQQRGNENPNTLLDGSLRN